MEQQTLFGKTRKRVRVDGETYEPDLDEKRLSSQLERVKALLLDGQWRGLAELAASVNGSEAGVSARIRDLRKQRFGAWTIERRRVDGGYFEYRLKS